MSIVAEIDPAKTRRKIEDALRKRDDTELLLKIAELMGINPAPKRPFEPWERSIADLIEKIEARQRKDGHCQCGEADKISVELCCMLSVSPLTFFVFWKKGVRESRCTRDFFTRKAAEKARESISAKRPPGRSDGSYKIWEDGCNIVDLRQALNDFDPTKTYSTHSSFPPNDEEWARIDFLRIQVF